MINDITAHVLPELYTNVRLNFLAVQDRPKIRTLIHNALTSISPGGPNDWSGNQLNVHTRSLIQTLTAKLENFTLLDAKGEVIKLLDLSSGRKDSLLTSYIESRVAQYFDARGKMNGINGPEKVFSSEWLAHLKSRGILLDPAEELDWSGKGQHVEYMAEEERDIPLISEKIMGHSQTAIVDSVKCRRIRLARKKITCNRHLKKEDAVTEVEHLLRLQHAHIVRLVGTYTIRRQLAILLYPAADWDLDAFLDDQLEIAEALQESNARALERFFGCLANAMAFIHEHNVKHMDIKPKNILVKQRAIGVYRVYIADFGIARSYQSPADLETDSPVSFTRIYAAPEVVLQDKRGLKADVFSLGCVFTEMLATLYSMRAFPKCDERQRLLVLRKERTNNPAFHANIDVVTQWYEDTIQEQIFLYVGSDGISTAITELFPRMITHDSGLRPTSFELKDRFARVSCHVCDAGPEPFEAAE